MIPRKLQSAQPLLRAASRATATQRSLPLQLLQHRHASDLVGPEITDPSMNGGYVNPPRQKRALRDPYGGWWDQQERRNFGEPLHEDNDILGVFTTEPYTHATPGKAGLHFITFVFTVLGLCAVVSRFYPDKVSVPKEYDDGLEAEMGGSRAWIVSIFLGVELRWGFGDAADAFDRRIRRSKGMGC